MGSLDSVVSKQRGYDMNRDRIKGSAEQAKGTVKEAAGKATGDKKLEIKGKADKVAGKMQSTFGRLKDAVRGK
jgi:uncharacterized protein YjbJ (UPF0337 family)